MSLKGQALRDLVVERLVIAADEIFALFERTLAEYGEEVREKLRQEPRPGAGLQSPPSPDVCSNPDLVKEEQDPALSFLFGPISLKSLDNGDSSSLRREEPAAAEEEEEDHDREKLSSGLDLPFENEQENEGQAQSGSDTDDSNDWEPSARSTAKHNGRESSSGQRKSSRKKTKRATFEIINEGRRRKSKCAQCGEAFQSQALLQEHSCTLNSLSNSNIGRQRKKQTRCKRGFRRERTLLKHMELDGEDSRRFSCPECGLRVKQKHSMFRHISTVHRGVRPYSCPVCQKAFAQKGYFVIHMRTHTGEKPFVCAVCSRSFGVKCSLKRHMRIHGASSVPQEEAEEEEEQM